MKRIAFLSLFLLLSLSNASLIWQYGSDGAISAKPVIFQGDVAIASDDGNIYLLDPASGSKRWQAEVGKDPNEIFIFDNSLVASTTKGKIVKVGSTGKITWTTDLSLPPNNVSRIYGASASPNVIYATTNNGVYVIEKNGTLRSKIYSYNDSIAGVPMAGPNYVIFGKDRDLFKIGENGALQWRAWLNQGSFWLSRPVVSGNLVYVGALDSRLHAFTINSGAEAWTVLARNWVSGTPLVVGNSVYFGSNDGKVYGADAASGEVAWIAQTQLAVQTQPESGRIGGNDVIFVGGSDRSTYAISTQTGQIVWKGRAESAVGSPLFYQNKVIFGTGDGRIYAYSTERACSITTPKEGDVIGTKELVVSGNYVSEAGGATVLVQINDGQWEAANTSEMEWAAYIDPKARLNPGINTISCKVSDAGGEETGASFTSIFINHDPNMAPSMLVVTVSPDIIEDIPFTVFVNDADDGSPIDRFTLMLQETKYKGDKNLSFTVAEPGTYPMTIKKVGFRDATVNINVNASGVNPLYLVIGLIVITFLSLQVWNNIKQRSGKKRRS